MKLNWHELSERQFIEEFWQQKPVLLKNAIPDFTDPISANELAGLAMEDFIDSRIVSVSETGWTVQHGPFADFSKQGESHWSLLVQGVDEYFKDVKALQDYFGFMPGWRFDDIMVSYSTPHSGLGAHIDQYDVFILQGQGKRRWQAGAVDKHIQQYSPTRDLRLVESFDPIVDAELVAGDIIYIPPFSPHEGKTIDSSLNFSIGFRAPSTQELFSSFADYLIDSDLGNERYTDTLETLDPRNGDELARERIQSQLAELLGDKKLIEEWLDHFQADD